MENLNENDNENDKMVLTVKINAEETYTLVIPTTISIQELAVVTQRFAQLLKQFRGDIELTTKPNGKWGKKLNPRGIPREGWIKMINATDSGDETLIAQVKAKYGIIYWSPHMKYSVMARHKILYEDLEEKEKKGNGLLHGKSKQMKGGKN